MRSLSYHDQNLNTSLMDPSRVTTAAPIPGLQKKQAGTHMPPDPRDIASAACAQYLQSYTEAYNDYVDSWERGNMLSTMANARAYDTYLERAREAWEVYQQACLSSYTALSPETAHYPNTRHLIDVALRSSSSSPKPPLTNAAFTPSSHLGTHGDLRRRQADDVSEAHPPSGSKAAPRQPPPPAYTPAAATTTTTAVIDTHGEKDEPSDMWTVQSHNTDPDPPDYGLPATDAKTFASYRVMTTTSSEVIPSYGVSAAAASSEDDHEPPETETETETTGSSPKSGTRTLPVFTRTTQPTTDPDYGVPTATTDSGDGLSEAAATATESLVLINAAPGGGGGGGGCGGVVKEVVMLLVIGMGLYAGGILFGC
ncbi:hypothetical protein QBC46DRAFT_117464 [Diplogelasinospora grovesii]|uniref:Uncharacterized protein n=1 Tax=Diplogelasinospora grovesii TaxID=303347 RepID=A0AAN6NHV4_9PEZI|nr:hypothetical protein QBC46DRAFT_117464 [Diplogelasinospora grovesii]